VGGECVKRVILTRSEEDIEKDRGFFEDLGFEVVSLPLIRTIPLEFQVPEEEFSYIVFQSAKAVTYFLSRADIPPGVKVVAVGDKTKQVLGEMGYTAHIVPQEFSAEGIVKALPAGKGEAVLIPRAEEGRREALEGLIKKGYRVFPLNVYRTENIRYDSAAVERLLTGGGYIVFASPSAVKGLFANLQKDSASALFKNLVVVAIGKTTKRELEIRGVEVDIVPPRPLISAVAGIIHRFWQENC